MRFCLEPHMLVCRKFVGVSVYLLNYCCPPFYYSEFLLLLDLKMAEAQSRATTKLTVRFLILSQVTSLGFRSLILRLYIGKGAQFHHALPSSLAADCVSTWECSCKHCDCGRPCSPLSNPFRTIRRYYRAIFSFACLCFYCQQPDLLDIALLFSCDIVRIEFLQNYSNL